MSFYRNTLTGEIRELDDSLVAAWQAASNPKAGVWEAYTPPPPEPPSPLPPAPDWARFQADLQSANGFPAAWGAIFQDDARHGIGLIAALYAWQTTGQWQPFLSAARACLALLGDQAPHVGPELLALAVDCRLDPAFCEALEATLEAE